MCGGRVSKGLKRCLEKGRWSCQAREFLGSGQG